MLLLGIMDFITYFLLPTKHENADIMDELTDKNIFEVIIIKYGVYAITLLFLANELKHIILNNNYNNKKIIRCKIDFSFKNIPCNRKYWILFLNYFFLYFYLCSLQNF